MNALFFAFNLVAMPCVVTAAAHGTCEVRDFKDIETKNLCSKWLDATLPSFLREGEDLETVAVKIKIVFSLIDDFGKELCIPFYKVIKVVARIINKCTI
jgi:hypothetical protein